MARQRVIPLWAIVGASLFLAYLAFFVRPVFLNPVRAMSMPQYIAPATEYPIGADLCQMLDYSTAWFDGRPAPFDSWHYPPLQRVMFLALTPLPTRTAYALLTGLNILAFLSVVLLLPMLARREADRAALALIAATGLISYGFQFELERGQSNVVAMALVAWALYLFHRGKNAWAAPAAWLLFTAAIQIKIYPAVFVFAFARNARAWKQNVWRWAALGGLNFACLFALGPAVFRKFVADVADHMANWGDDPRNMSIKSFAGQFAYYMRHRLHLPITAGHVQIACGIVLATAFALILAWACYRNRRGAFKYVIGVCSLAALLVPAVSFDYKLTLLTMMFALFIGESDAIELRGRHGLPRTLLTVALSLFYAATLFPQVFKPKFLQSNTPELIGICLVFMMLLAVEEGDLRRRQGSVCPPP